MKRLIIIVIALVLVGVGAAGAQLGSEPVIERLTGETRGGWVKIDKSPQSPGYQRVYCITVDEMPSCDWNDVRKIVPKDFLD